MVLVLIDIATGLAAQRAEPLAIPWMYNICMCVCITFHFSFLFLPWLLTMRLGSDSFLSFFPFFLIREGVCPHVCPAGPA